MEEIIRRLRNRDSISMRSLKESLPVHGISEDEELPIDEEIPDEEVEDETPDEETESEDEIDTEESPDTLEDPDESDDSSDHVNPLDNAYAVNYKIGQQVILTYSNGAKTKLAGTIDGYDKEGFYRIKWSNGKTTSGLTDIALADLVEETNESTCVCGSTSFVTEGKLLVCDKCGRHIRESIDLPDANKKSSKKSKIRSKLQGAKTSLKPSIEESIRKAFKSKSVNEDYDEDEYDDEYDEEEEHPSNIPPQYHSLYDRLNNQFWTRLPELQEDIEDLGYIVDDINEEYVIIATDEGDEEALQVFLGGTSRTFTLDFSRARIV